MDRQIKVNKSLALTKLNAANCNKRWHKTRSENYIMNNSDVINARGVYMQKYQDILDAAFFYCDEEECKFLYKRYEAETDKERDEAIRLAIRILTKSIDK